MLKYQSYERGIMSLPKLSVQEIALILFALISFLFLLRLFQLQRQISTEKKKRFVPMLTFEIDTDTPGLYLKNTGEYPAINIKIANLPLTLEYLFQKTFILKFESIQSIGAHQRIKLKYKAFDGTIELVSIHPDNLVVYLPNASFNIHLTYSNLENITFSADVAKGEDDFVIKQITPVTN